MSCAVNLEPDDMYWLRTVKSVYLSGCANTDISTAALCWYTLNLAVGDLRCM